MNSKGISVIYFIRHVLLWQRKYTSNVSQEYQSFEIKLHLQKAFFIELNASKLIEVTVQVHRTNERKAKI